jgi:23S rRNA (adenine2503-C2)-methyltransferase
MVLSPVPAPPRELTVQGREDLAFVHVAEMRGDPRLRVEFVDALDPRFARSEKWVVIVSSQFGCPVGCAMCETGGWFHGNLTADELLWQVDRVVLARHPDGSVPSRKFKVQFARMGEPALNPAVLDALVRLRTRYEAPGLLPCVATVAPTAGLAWLHDLAELKASLYAGGAFQLQFSINTTDDALRDRLMPSRRWSLAEIAAFGDRWYRPGDRRIVLNFALAEGWPVDPDAIAATFPSDRFVVKLTPLNPTRPAIRAGFGTVLSESHPGACDGLVEAFARCGFDCIVSIGKDEEIALKSNCGQAVAVGWAREAPL